MRIFEKLPTEIREKGVDLKGVMGINSLAWKSEDVKRIIQVCLNNGFAIIGGAVIEENVGGVFSHTYDNWF